MNNHGKGKNQGKKTYMVRNNHGKKKDRGYKTIMKRKQSW